jgi:hypothetical protein
MQLPFSEPEPTPASAASSPAPPAKTSADQSVTAIVLADDRFLPLPQFAPHIPDDPTPAKEDQAEAWVKEMCKHARIWRRKLVRLTRESDPETLEEEFAKMYATNTDASVADFFQCHFRRPDAAADTKPFPVRVAPFYIFVCTCAAAIILLVLLMSR